METSARIREVIQRTHNVKSFRLDIGGAADFRAGQFLLVTVKGDSEITRPLSISSSPTEKGYIEFTKKITNSEFSAVINRLNTGDVVKIKYPFGNFTFNGEYPKIAFLSGGVGITPVKSICKYAVDRNLGTDIVLLYGNCSAKDIVFGDDFDRMQKEYPKLKVTNVLQESDPACPSKTGIISSSIIKEDVSDYAERKFFICGPPTMVEAMKNALIGDLRIQKENIITEDFNGY